jgi:uncharacterized protein with PQ loop repeat
MGFKKFFKKLGKNLFAGLIGGIIGITAFVFYVIKIWLPLNAAKIGFGVIIMLPIMIILFSIIGIIVGSIGGIIIYQILRFINKK